MGAAAKHRENLVESAVRLFQERGYAGTGLAEILAESGAPKGSLYHYFPDGKEQLAEAALAKAGETVAVWLAQLRESCPDSQAMVRAYGTGLARYLAKSGFRQGCAIAGVLLDVAPASPRLTAVGRAALDCWSGALAERLRADGVDADEAGRLADFAITVLQGSLVLARARQSEGPVLEGAERVATLFAAETDKARTSTP